MLLPISLTRPGRSRRQNVTQGGYDRDAASCKREDAYLCISRGMIHKENLESQESPQLTGKASAKLQEWQYTAPFLSKASSNFEKILQPMDDVESSVFTFTGARFQI